MEPNIKGGCILLARKIIESEIWEKPPLYIKVWVFLLSSAQFKQYKNMSRGQVFTSIPEIIEGCKWRVGARIERPTKDQIYQVIEWLRKPNEGGNESNAKATMITTAKATQGMLINIDNYDFYQTLSNYESNDESNDEKATKAERKQRQPDNINKNDNNGEEGNKNDELNIVDAKASKRFIKPTIQQVFEYCQERKNNVDAERFIDYHDSNGWKVGKNAMKDWKATVRTWEKNSKPSTSLRTMNSNYSTKTKKEEQFETFKDFAQQRFEEAQRENEENGIGAAPNPNQARLS